MRISLLPFQEERTSELLRKFRRGREEYRDEKEEQAVTLSAPTGSGKTVMMTAFIEQLLFGEQFSTLGEHQDDVSGDTNYAFLWLTDQPELNEQTRDKMLDTISGLRESDLVTINEAFNEETFAPGSVYFLNTQKLRRVEDSNYVWRGDRRTWTLWETITNTVEQRPDHFVLIVDEAHKGMQDKDGESSTTIAQKFVKGSDERVDHDDEDATVAVPPIPLIVGVSATIKRFDQVIGKTNRTKRPVDVTVEEVRESGLVKDVTELKHSDLAEHSDITLLLAAVEEWKQFRDEWASYAAKEGVELLDPILLIQVVDGTKTVVTKSDLGAILDALHTTLPDAPDEWFAHAFQEHKPIRKDGHTLRYVKPSAIDGDPDVRVVLFKTALNTGWDCPRAEVMVSFRTAVDDTLIAQLVGRMVRARLARRVIDNELLNSVSLYLPHFDDAGLDAVVDKLNGDEDTKTATTARRAGTTVHLQRAQGDVANRCFDRFSALPSYSVPPRRVMKPVVRLLGLAGLLAELQWERKPVEDARRALTNVLVAEHARLQATETFSEEVENGVTVVLKSRTHRYGAEKAGESRVESVLDLDAGGLDQLYRDADRSLGGEGLNTPYMSARRKAGQTDDTRTKVEFILLARDHHVRAALDNRAHELTKKWVDKYRLTFAKPTTTDEARNRFIAIQGSAREPQSETPQVPSNNIEWPKSSKLKWEKHLFVNEQGEFWEDFEKSSWERLVVKTELERGDVVAWLRNLDRKPWALKAVYQVGTDWVPVYPDFVFFREIDGDIVADMLDPHLLTARNTPERARGLATYASKHWQHFGRIELIVVTRSGGNDTIRRLNLMDEDVRKAVAQVTSSEELGRLFDSA